MEKKKSKAPFEGEQGFAVMYGEKEEITLPLLLLRLGAPYPQ